MRQGHRFRCDDVLRLIQFFWFSSVIAVSYSMSCCMIPKLEGACLCGSIQWQIYNAEVSEISVCHCQSCRRNSGGTEIPFCAVNRLQLWSTLKDNPTLHSSVSYCTRTSSKAAEVNDTIGASSRRFFCGKCSTSLAVEINQDEGCLWIPIGTLKEFDPSFVDPTRDFHACCNEEANFASSISNLQQRCNEVVIRILTQFTSIRLVLLIRMAASLRWLIVNVISLLQYHSTTIPYLASPTPRRRTIAHLEGSCECGKIHWQAANVFMSKVCVCHCGSCQKCSGTNGIPFCALDRATMRQAIFGQNDKNHQPNPNEAASTTLVGSYASSTIATRYFCTTCASPVAFQYNQETDVLWIPMGTFSNFDPSLLDSNRDAHIFCKEEKKVFSALANLPKRHDTSGNSFDLHQPSSSTDASMIQHCRMVSDHVLQDRRHETRFLKA